MDTAIIRPREHRLSLKNIILDLLGMVGSSLVILGNSIDPGNLSADIDEASLSEKRNLFFLVLSGLIGSLMYILSIKLVISSGKSLSALVKEIYPKEISYLIYVSLEVAILVTGMQVIL